MSEKGKNEVLSFDSCCFSLHKLFVLKFVTNVLLIRIITVQLKT